MSDQTVPFDRLCAVLASRYRDLREIGQGGMATVYAAQEIKHDRRVAIKVLTPEVAAALGRERFVREIQITAVLTHPHILPLLDSGEADDCVFYVMPYVEGETLRDRLQRERQLPVDEALQIVREVADALTYAHSHGIVHRDIKPDNILFMGQHAVVADFGVATAVTAASANTRLTQSGVTVGTPTYMSPEQAAGEAVIDGRSDTYSLACVLYEMLAGEPPYTGATPQAVLARKLTSTLAPLSSVRDAVSPELDNAVRRALSKTPADRYRTPTEFAVAAAAAKTSPTPTARGSSKLRMPRVALSAIVLLALLVAGVLWRARSDDGPGSTAATPGQKARQPIIGVLPFENLGAAEQDYFAAGMTDEIASRLSAVSGLGVVPSRAVQRYARTEKTMREIGRELNIDYLIAGSVRWAAGGPNSRTVRVTLELLQVSNERQVWSTSYDRVIDDIFAVQSDIAAKVAERLGVALLEGERRILNAQPTKNHEAYTLYLKGRYFWNKRTEDNIQTALDYFQRAADMDPAYSLAWAGVADVWIFRGWYGLLAPRETFPKAKQAALRALEFDSLLAEAHASLAHIHFEYDHDWPAAEREYLRAIQLNPRYAVAHHWYGGFLSAMGRHEEAMRQAELARSLEPLSPIIQTWTGLRYYFNRKYDQAIAEYAKALEMDRDFAPAHWHLGWAYEQAGRFDEGIAEAQRAVAIDSANLMYLASLGHAYAKAGKKQEARAILTRLTAVSSKQHVSPYDMAAIHIALGDADSGMDWLERAFDERSPWIGYMNVDPRVDAVRSHPRFARLLQRARLKS